MQQLVVQSSFKNAGTFRMCAVCMLWTSIWLRNWSSRTWKCRSLLRVCCGVEWHLCSQDLVTKNSLPSGSRSNLEVGTRASTPLLRSLHLILIPCVVYKEIPFRMPDWSFQPLFPFGFKNENYFCVTFIYISNCINVKLQVFKSVIFGIYVLFIIKLTCV